MKRHDMIGMKGQDGKEEHNIADQYNLFLNITNMKSYQNNKLPRHQASVRPMVLCPTYILRMLIFLGPT